jgi:hypothetical protein
MDDEENEFLFLDEVKGKGKFLPRTDHEGPEGE